MKAALARVLQLRAQWPDRVKRYVASMYGMEPDAWERVAQFIDAGVTVRLKPDTTNCCSTPKYAGMPT